MLQLILKSILEVLGRATRLMLANWKIVLLGIAGYMFGNWVIQFIPPFFGGPVLFRIVVIGVCIILAIHYWKDLLDELFGGD